MNTKVPSTIAGRRIPARFRNPLISLDSPVEVLREFIGWLESSVVARPRPDAEFERLRADRGALVSALVELGDLLDSRALRDKAARALDAAGVTSLEPTGERFDASQHRAVTRVPAPDPVRHAHVAETERVGYSDRGHVLRPPEVRVYWHEASDGG